MSDKLGLTTSFAMGTALLLASFASQTEPSRSSEYPTPNIREEQEVVVGGLAEIWQLKWTTLPKSICGPTSADWSTCPCAGFAFGETGHLTLLRMRGGTEIDHMDLTPFCGQREMGNGRLPIVQRWQPEDKDFEASKRQDFPALVTKRRIVQVMHFADYEHDGSRSEFYWQIDTLPCGKSIGIVIGVSRRNPRLHVLGKVSKPGSPLYMQEKEWDALRQASGPVEVLDWACGDHGAETETRLWLRWTPAGVDGTNREYSCPEDNKPATLLHEKPL